MKKIPLEDLFQDVIGKARRGLKLTESQLAQKAGIPLETLEALQDGRIDPDALARSRRHWTWTRRRCSISARAGWEPAEAKPPATFAMFNTPFDDMTVNAYLVWEKDGGPAAVFDTGMDHTGMLAAIREHHLQVQAILLTHTHMDHVARIDELVNHTGAPVYVSEFEKLAGTTADFGRARISRRRSEDHRAPDGRAFRRAARRMWWKA